MITLAELRTYSDELEQDELLNSAIEFSKSFLESECNRVFEYAEFIDLVDYTGEKRIYLKVNPIAEITAIKYYIENDYTDLFDSLTNELKLRDAYFEFRNGSSPNELKIGYKGGYKFQTQSGTLAGTIGTDTIIGTSTDFVNDLALNDRLIINGFERKVSVITDATHLTLNDNLPETIAGVSYILNTYPADLRGAALKLAAYYFQESSLGNNLLYLSSKNVSIGGTASDTYKKLDIKSTVEKYKFINV